MSNLCVAGDTKIRIKYPQAIYDDIGEIYDWKVYEKEIEIGDLDECISSREIGIMYYKVSDNDPCEDVPQIKVLSYNIQSNQEEWNPITAFAETSPKAKVIRITDEESGKSIVVTPEHKVFTKNRGYVMAKDLTETDELVIN
jgi:intein/homing endonuclease